MKTLTSHDILRLWEEGDLLHPLDQAVSILSSAFPDIPYRELAELSLGERDRYLLLLRASVFGNRLPAYCECEHCREPLEFLFQIPDILLNRPSNPDTEFRMVWDEGQLDIRYRLPNSLDLGLAISGGKAEMAYDELVRRCIHCRGLDDSPVEIEDLPEQVLEEIIRSIEEMNSQSEVFLDLVCPECKGEFQMLFDISSYFWIELRTFARRLLDDVRQLAFHYGWSEGEILSMSSKRRQYYLEMVET